ncbi:hypothetical protein [Nocardia nova]|uniref:hypothetical protein n=1 Tax=Nocardia nova TaxID=37330 RepID=UPI002739A59A|nr:hypothetical protein [Nocardia nova]
MKAPTPEEMRLLKIREVSLPPALRMPGGVKRDLRDAFYGRYMVCAALLMAPHMRHPLRELALEMERVKARDQFTGIITELSAAVGPEWTDKCRDAGRVIFSWQFNQQDHPQNQHLLGKVVTFSKDGKTWEKVRSKPAGPACGRNLLSSFTELPAMARAAGSPDAETA